MLNSTYKDITDKIMDILCIVLMFCSIILLATWSYSMIAQIDIDRKNADLTCTVSAYHNDFNN